MARLLLLVLTLVGSALVLVAKSPGLLGLGLLLGLVGMCGFVLSLAAARVSTSARPEASMASVEDLVALRRKPESAPGAAGHSAGARVPAAASRTPPRAPQ